MATIVIVKIVEVRRNCSVSGVLAMLSSKARNHRKKWGVVMHT